MINNKKLVIAVIGVVLCIVIVVLALVLNRKGFIPKEEKIIKKAVSVLSMERKEPHVLKKPVSKPYKVSEKPIITPRVLKGEKVRSKTKQNYYERLTNDVRNFFDYLDQRDYIKTYRLKNGTQRHFLLLLAKLSANPPVVSGETRDIYTLTHNMAHFYRVIDKKNISIVKDVLSHEREIIEPTMEMLYEWITEEIKRKNKEVKTSTGDLYEYACFFLNTMSGKAYLARRDSKTRILMIYYSLLILDKANRENLNHNGIDILPPLNMLVDDITSQMGLDYKEKYLQRLYYIKKRVVSHREKRRIKE
ncbi:MAG: hypothetical protein DRH24_05825 [Deltaproteobacteria bacterium]|nr:MAG: hypothetical protein B1H13_01435 [Desulfobacteraceae bacterium 4484_190.3]RLB84170.1 MAG: hypothetical protein DRH24_05825 [Deltaproteobacteria bacterium]